MGVSPWFYFNSSTAATRLSASAGGLGDPELGPCGVGLGPRAWVGAEHWEQNGDGPESLEELLDEFGVAGFASLARAHAVHDALVARGVDDARIQPVAAAARVADRDYA